MIAALVVAAGAGRRFGGGKLVAPLAGRPLVDHVLAAVQAATGPDERLVVVRPGDEQIAALARARRFDVVPALHADRGLALSLRAGLHAVPDAEAVVVVLGDGPALVPATIDRLIAARGRSHALRPAYADGILGHPVLLERALLERAGELVGDRGFGPLLLHATVEGVDCSDLPDPGDVDRPGDLVAIARGMRPG